MNNGVQFSRRSVLFVFFISVRDILISVCFLSADEAKIAANSTDVIQLLKTLQELLQNAIQKKRPTRLWESVYTISGPLTWKDFHLLAGRGWLLLCLRLTVSSAIIRYILTYSRFDGDIPSSIFNPLASLFPIVYNNNNNNNPICKAPECQKTSVALYLLSPIR